MRARWVLFALFFGTLLLFSRGLRHDFVDYDDPDYVTRNPHVQAGLTAATVRWAFTTGTAGNWHPLTWLSHALDWQLFGPNAHGHHAVSIFWHALNAALVFAVLRQLTGACWTSALCAALFAWHPLRVESVAWVAERKDVLCAFFGLLTLWAFARFAEASAGGNGKAKRFYALALLAFALGLMSKPMLVTLPFVMALLDVWPLRRFSVPTILEKIPFVALSAAACVVTYFAQRHAGAMADTAAPSDRLANAVVAVGDYLRDFFWPCGLAIGYPKPAHWPVERVVLATLFVAWLTVLAVWQRRRRPFLLVGWLWFLGMLVPVIGLVQVGQQARADRYTYLPVLGLQLALLWTARDLVTLAPRWRRASLAVAAFVLVAGAARTWDQLGVWRNSRTLYEHALAVTKNNYLAHSYLGAWLFNENRLEKARAHFERSLAIKPDYAVAHDRLGLVLERLGQPDEALTHYERAFALRPDDLLPHLHLANALAGLGRDEQALTHYQKVLALNPELAEVHRDYGDSLRTLKRFDDACAEYRRALALQPRDADANYGLAATLENLGQHAEAMASYRAAVRLDGGLSAPAGDEALLETWGWVVAQEKGVAGVEIDDAELAAFMRGFSASLARAATPPDFRKIYPDVERLAKERRQKLVHAIEQRNEAAAAKFFLELKATTSELPGGVRCQILRPGDGPAPKLEQTVTIRYVGHLIDGTEFTQFGPIDMVLVPNRRMWRGWTDAVQRLSKGGAMKLYVPPPLPEAEASNWGIEPGSAMVFDVELLDIKATSPEALASGLAPPPPDEPLPPSGASEGKIMEAWGWSVAQQSGIPSLNFSAAERTTLANGLRAGIKGQPASADLAKLQPLLEAFIANRNESARQAARRQRHDEMTALFAELKRNPNVVELPDGLRYEILKPGSGPAPKPGQIVLVDYTGRLIDGSVFDRTDNEPLHVEVGSVIRGWNEGIQRINRGGKIKLYIPPELGYKEMAISGHLGPIPPGSTLIYEIELLDIKDTLPGSEPENKK